MENRFVSKFILVTAAFAAVFFSCPAQAGELWIDYFEERFPICPPAGAKNATLDERAGDFLYDMVYELDKELAPDDPEPSLAPDASGTNKTILDPAYQSQLRERMDRIHSSIRFLLPPMQSGASPPPPAGLHAPLRAAFTNMLDRTPVDDTGTEEMLGPVLKDFIAAKATADILLSDTGAKPNTERQSKDLLVALEQMDNAYRKARLALLGLVGREDFSALLEMQLWAECLGGAERKDG